MECRAGQRRAAQGTKRSQTIHRGEERNGMGCQRTKSQSERDRESERMTRFRFFSFEGRVGIARRDRVHVQYVERSQDSLVVIIDFVDQ